MADRVELQRKLEELLGSRNVYFQPPESIKLNYPCIVYNLSGVSTKHADDRLYKADKSYTVTLMHKNPDNDIFDKLLNFPKSRFDRSFVSDNINHYTFTIFY